MVIKTGRKSALVVKEIGGELGRERVSLPKVVEDTVENTAKEKMEEGKYCRSQSLENRGRKKAASCR